MVLMKQARHIAHSAPPPLKSIILGLPSSHNGALHFHTSQVFNSNDTTASQSEHSPTSSCSEPPSKYAKSHNAHNHDGKEHDQEAAVLETLETLKHVSKETSLNNLCEEDDTKQIRKSICQAQVYSSATDQLSVDHSAKSSSKLYNLNLQSFSSKNGSYNHDLKRFLDLVGTKSKEARFWLKYFQKMSLSNPLFAIVQIEEEVLNESNWIHRTPSGEVDLDQESPLSELCSYLAFLQRHGMKCVITHGQSTSDSDPEVLYKKIVSDSQLIIDLLEKNDTQVRQIGIPPLRVVFDDTSSSYKVESVDPSYLSWMSASNHIPVLPNIARTTNQQIVTVPLFEATSALSIKLLPLKVMIVNIKGGIKDQRGKVIPNINLPEDELVVKKSSWCKENVKTQVHDIALLLSKIQERQLSLGRPPENAIVITSCKALLTEIFTHYGSGTFFKITEKMTIHKNLDDIDVGRLKTLVQGGFGKDLKDSYMENLEKTMDSIILSEGYSAVAIVTREPGISVPYLDKFVVRHDQQDNSLGCLLWERIEHMYPTLFWRSKNINLINPWYFKHSEGSWNNGRWTVFWYGVQQHRQTSEFIDHALEKDSSFKNDENHL